MSDTEDTNAAVWKSDIGVTFWKSAQQEREQRRAGHRALMAELLPFAPDQPFTFVDLEGVDVFWKELDYVIYGGRRPLP